MCVDRPSKSWDAASTRILTIAVFQHRSTSKTVVAMNTHLGSYISDWIFLFRTKASITRLIVEAKGCFHSSDLCYHSGSWLGEAMLTPNSTKTTKVASHAWRRQK